MDWSINKKTKTNINWNWQFRCCSSFKTQWGLVVKTVESLALGQTGHSRAKPQPAETRQETHADPSRAGDHVRSDQWRLEGPDQQPLNSSLHSHHCYSTCTTYPSRLTASFCLLYTAHTLRTFAVFHSVCLMSIKGLSVKARSSDEWCAETSWVLGLNIGNIDNLYFD